ncbi:ATPase, histidine kinase-, DNA gyrase B-, and HSP90-like domain protein [Verrucomicrobiia bacterium DG1235]|nr:ATPase, histidine kinase-, DNA gyrase B-, and HSP90-like domain protein [Verrucomicrobiae bacterium DG1235]
MSLNVSEESDIPSYKQLSVRVFVGLLGFLLLVIGATYFAIQTAAHRTLSDQAEKLHREVGKNIVLKLGERVVSTETLAKSLAKLGESLPKDDSVYSSVIAEMLDSEAVISVDNRLIAGGGIWPEPNQYEEGVDRRSFFWSRDEKRRLVYFDDYNDPNGMGYHNEEWYVPARYLNPGEVYWSKSYMDPYSFVPMVTCTAPYWNDGRFAGVATVDLRLDGISEFMAEQAQQIDGYAFAVDRNNRLISFPDSELGRRTSLDEAGNKIVEYRLVGEVSPGSPSFGLIASRIEKFHTSGPLGSRESQEGESSWLAAKIDAESYQIDEIEAKSIAESLIYRRSSGEKVQQFRVEKEFLLGQSALVSLFSVPSTDWVVLIAMPSEYSDKAVALVVGRVSKLVLIVVFIICILLYFFLWRSVFSPANALRGEVRKLALEGQSRGRLELEGDDEFGRIAYWFNKRTDQLSEALMELKLSNSELEEAKQAAESASRTKNVFLASMSHEIRTPMNAIIGLSSLLAEMDMSKEQSNFVGTIRASAESLLSLINDILDYTKIEANELELEEVPFDLREIMEELTGMVSLQADEKGLGFSCYLDTATEGMVLGDPGRVRQILLNLATNAIKFTISGRVDISGACIEETDTHYVLGFSVKDTGIGIPETAFGSLFDSFRQVDSTTTRKYGGTGLGLAICKRLCEKMGGEIQVTSKVGLGSEFSFIIRLGKVAVVEGRGRQRSLEAIGWEAFVLDNDWPHGESLLSELKRFGVQSRLFADLSEMEGALARCRIGAVVFAGQVHGRSHEQLLWDLVSLDQPRLVGVVSFSNPLRALALSSKVKEEIAGTLQKPFSRARLESCLRKIDLRDAEDEGLGEEVPKVGADGVFAGFRVLLVEDHPVNRKVATHMLSSLGVSVVVACDGLEALERVEGADKLDAVLMDWQMPVMDGLDASRKIREMKDWRAKVPIVAMTANAMRGDREKCIAAGMDDYLSKPVVPEKLKEVLSRILRREG